MVCNADKVIGNKPTKQRYVRLFRKDSKCCSAQGGKRTYLTQSMCMVCFDEVTTTKAFSARNLKHLAVVENDAAEPIYIPWGPLHSMVLMCNQLIVVSNYIRRMNMTLLQIYVSPATRWVVEDWRCAPRYPLGKRYRLSFPLHAAIACLIYSGVPQGSVHAWSSFVPHIYINDLPDCLVPPVQAKIFADDTKLYVAHSSDSISPLTLYHCRIFVYGLKAGSLILLFRNVM